MISVLFALLCIFRISFVYEFLMKYTRFIDLDLQKDIITSDGNRILCVCYVELILGNISLWAIYEFVDID